MISTSDLSSLESHFYETEKFTHVCLKPIEIKADKTISAASSVSSMSCRNTKSDESTKYGWRFLAAVGPELCIFIET